MTLKTAAALTASLLVTCSFVTQGHAADDADKIKPVVDAAIRPVMDKNTIPGMAIGVIFEGKSYIFEYGVASKETGKAITPSTIFEVGSVSKTFVATLASYAQVNGQLSFSDKVEKYLPALKGTAFGDVALLHLATHTPGGFPLQVPDEVKTDKQMMAYLKNWKPAYKVGTTRTYANPSIGMLGVITAKAMKKDFSSLMEGQLFPALGLTSTYINVPKSKMADYAQGYSSKDKPSRVSKAVLSAEAYGVKTTVTDMVRVMQANMNMVKLDAKLQQAITNTHTGYFKAGVMTQDLLWEQYSYPVALDALRLGNSSKISLEPVPVDVINPPSAPRDDVLINKTGSTNGFGAYVAFVPEKQLGIVILANKYYPNTERIEVAHEILTKLDAR
ncbi:class C beta-lactamase [Phyllobacterium sp. YR531]|uniref:class C beta-lactamase n=1 Tax=Phyllobacterium sp. YR531 TaxID=1144343 RepID=UPI00026F75FA|nr:class C beta-lactamase [Phyllobacterium sp. YR531]EJM98882.1 penicillin-binding protein, beta-lactamase class C [Phyllobacterium sp. YR531]